MLVELVVEDFGVLGFAFEMGFETAVDVELGLKFPPIIYISPDLISE